MTSQPQTTTLVGQPRQRLAPLFRQRLLLRAGWACATFVLPIMLALMAHSHARTLELASIAMPYALLVPIAAIVPQSLPARSELWLTVAIIFAILSANDFKRGVDWFSHASHTQEVRVLRAIVSWTFMFGNAWMGLINWHERGAHFWTQLRAHLILGTAVRLVVVALLRQVGAPSGCYPPAYLDFESALVVNLTCIALSFAGLSSFSRRQVRDGNRSNPLPLPRWCPPPSCPATSVANSSCCMACICRPHCHMFTRSPRLLSTACRVDWRQPRRPPAGGGAFGARYARAGRGGAHHR